MKRLITLLVLGSLCFISTGCVMLRSTSKADLSTQTVKNSVTGVSWFKDATVIGTAYQGSDHIGTPQGTNYHRTRGLNIDELASKVSDQLEKTIKATGDAANPLP